MLEIFLVYDSTRIEQGREDCKIAKSKDLTTLPNSMSSTTKHPKIHLLTIQTTNGTSLLNADIVSLSKIFKEQQQYIIGN